VANMLRAQRKRRGWKLAELGGLTGLSVSYLSLIERGLREPAPATKVQLARAMRARVDELFPPDQTVA